MNGSKANDWKPLVYAIASAASASFATERPMIGVAVLFFFLAMDWRIFLDEKWKKP